MWLSVLSGVLLGLAFPFRIGTWEFPACGFLAWIGLVPLLLRLRGTSARTAWWRGFLTGAIYHALSLYWLYTAMHAFGGLAP
ncbi:MAG: apolipoprotein N-acyltransferase, partial [Deltaproteobacteria bacterium]|nr:apolipoprotein N-acyltransferase [Deltaproteobacteria bacterium]